MSSLDEQAEGKRHDVGNLDRDGFELRYQDDGDLDEIVARGADVHLERMNGSEYCLIVTMPSGETIHTFLYAPRRNERKRLPKGARRLTINLIDHPKVAT